jgi:glycosyltransferase involved in cell wall biosynthesis
MNPSIDVACICQDEHDVLPWMLRACETLLPNLRNVVIVDGGSVDDTRDIIDSWREKLPILLLERDLDTFCQQRNFALDHCTADYVLRIDADNTWGANLRDELVGGRFSHLINDLPVYWTVMDAYHHLPDHAGGVASIVIKNKGLRYVRPVHEYLVTVGEENPPDRLIQENRLDWNNVRSKPMGLQVVGNVPFFHHVYRKSDDALRDSAIKYARFAKRSSAAGIPIPEHDDEWRVRAKKEVLTTHKIEPLPSGAMEWVIQGT